MALVSTLIYLFFYVIAFILTTLIITAGLHPHILSDLYFIKTNTSSLSIPSSLSNSTFLVDLSKITGTDYVGSNHSASTLGLATEYTISLFTSCAKNITGGTTCTAPHLGFHFDLFKDLKLDLTALQGSVTDKVQQALSYGNASAFLGIAYIIAALLILITPILSLFKSRSAAIAAAVTSVFATLFLLTASTVSLATFIHFNGSFNSVLSSSGLKSALGNKMFILSWVATIFSLVTSVLLCIAARRSGRSQPKKRSTTMNPRGVSQGNLQSLPKPGFLQKLPTWKRNQSYSNIEKQGLVTGKGRFVENINEDEDMLLKRGFGGGIEEEEGYEREDLDLVRNQDGAYGKIIPLQLLRDKANRSMDTAYEPFRREGV